MSSSADPSGVSRQRMLSIARFALHLITALLSAVTAIRAIATGVPLLPAMLAAGVFLAWYAAGAAFARGRFGAWWLGFLGILWAGTLLISAEFVWLSFPLLLLAGHVLHRWPSVVFAVPVLVAAILAPILHQVTITFAHIVGPLLGGGFALGISLGYDALLRDAVERERLIASLVRTQDEMASLQEELARTQREAGATQERTRLARDLHDTIAQELSSMVLMARSGDVERLPQIESLAQHSLTDLRRIVAALAPAELEGAALAAAVERMLTSLRDDTGVQTSLHVDADLPSLPTSHEVAFLRVAQSALANVRQHAVAAHVGIEFAVDAGTVTMTVDDDGVGFDADAAAAPTTSYGLAAMRSRLREFGGALEVRSAPGEGTTLVAALPAAPAPEDGMAR
ncbi:MULTISPECIES: histidine kinase [unclassified Microbacterium]|uniref:sensor histidine kinase n=1 Tax=unclassified Microbacterium TaxID=2609290 RepID=UPI001DF13676|nr:MULTISPECIES: histidine kinase [unclassified Microbacterium]CAH0194865.1 Sensor histidine kinase LiaS [Microbacterium sp. Bi121]HWK78305.1 histidine kinase [Microbacterium sp.]